TPPAVPIIVTAMAMILTAIDAYPPRREAPRKGRGSRDSYPPQDPYNGRNSSRRDTYSNDWDDDDDEWF
ncbi:MAG: hypothetical protein AAFR63_03445, partial [Cyanobacteria bacterium J06631_6]